MYLESFAGGPCFLELVIVYPKTLKTLIIMCRITSRLTDAIDAIQKISAVRQTRTQELMGTVQLLVFLDQFAHALIDQRCFHAVVDSGRCIVLLYVATLTPSPALRVGRFHIIEAFSNIGWGPMVL